MNLKLYKELIEENLDKYLKIKYPEKIWDSMRYSVLNGGKRLRPIILLETSRIISGEYKNAIPVACALEMLHCQSLIHDDLPSMDNDDYRRGKLTNHKVFGESTAILAGDALLSFAPQIIIENMSKDIPCNNILKILQEFFIAAGANGIVAGQVVDIDSEGKDIDKDTLKFIHKYKTAALFKAACKMGAIIANGTDKQINEMDLFGENLGLAFQICDDILDEVSSLEELGKTPGKDYIAKKSTYIRYVGIDQSRIILKNYCNKAIEILRENNLQSNILEEITFEVMNKGCIKK